MPHSVLCGPDIFLYLKWAWKEKQLRTTGLVYPQNSFLYFIVCKSIPVNIFMLIPAVAYLFRY